MFYLLVKVNAAWTLTGSSEFAVLIEDFVLTCKPETNANAIIWRRSGTTIAAIEYNNRCDIQNPDPQFEYTCEPGPVYKLTIPASVMTNNQHNIVWRCESTFVPVSSVSLNSANLGYPAVNVLYENTPKTFTCVSNGCRPKANITVTSNGVLLGQRTERQGTQSDGLIVTTLTQTITASRGDIPSVEPTLSGYTTGTVLYEGDNSLTITGQQSGGHPLSVISWSCNGQTGTQNSSGTVASSYVQLTWKTKSKNLKKKLDCTLKFNDKSKIFTMKAFIPMKSVIVTNCKRQENTEMSALVQVFVIRKRNCLVDEYLCNKIEEIAFLAIPATFVSNSNYQILDI
ncbi:hypothetical protein KUTeg_006449 [Tegillarca granosa]|uniref:Ig-like domain-containing protein n=1 Tax=Tegillarca granosa TaxID=220873 RepID=A0ABQ9FJH2_TEGGR|nr:hypothetical protein KUTeg_006449 [Tegillarca granosa]